MLLRAVGIFKVSPAFFPRFAPHLRKNTLAHGWLFNNASHYFPTPCPHFRGKYALLTVGVLIMSTSFFPRPAPHLRKKYACARLSFLTVQNPCKFFMAYFYMNVVGILRFTGKIFLRAVGLYCFAASAHAKIALGQVLCKRGSRGKIAALLHTHGRNQITVASHKTTVADRRAGFFSSAVIDEYDPAADVYVFPHVCIAYVRKVGYFTAVSDIRVFIF